MGENVASTIEGKVASINGAGDLVTDIDSAKLSDVPRDQSVSVSFGPHETIGIHEKNHGEPDSTLIAILGDSGFLEIGIVGMSINEMLGIDVGTTITVKW